MDKFEGAPAPIFRQRVHTSAAASASEDIEFRLREHRLPVSTGEGENDGTDTAGGAVQDALASVAGERRDPDALRQGGGGRGPRPDRARKAGGAGAGRLRRGSSSSGRPGRGSAPRTGSRDAGLTAEIHEASDRIGGRCWTLRGAFADAQIAEHGGELIDQGHSHIRQLAQRLGLKLDNLLQAEQNGAELLGWFDGSPYTYEEMTDDIKAAWQKIHADVSAASYPTTFEISTERGRQRLDNMSIVDWIEETFGGGIDSRIGQALDVAYTIEYGAECAEQSALNLLYLLAYSGQGQFASSGPSNEKYHVAGGNDQITDRLASQLAGQITTGSELVAVRRDSTGVHAHVRAAVRHGPSRTGRARPSLLDPPFLGRPLEGGLRALEADLVRATSLNSKLHVQFSSRFWRPPGLERRDLRPHGLPEHVGGHARPARHQRHPRRLHGRQDRRELQVGHARVAGDAVPRPARAGHARRDEGVERPRGDRLLARLPLDEGLVLVLEGRSVPALRRDRGAAPGQLPLRGRAHVDRLPGLPQRRRRDGSAGGRRSSPT